ncbi:MAG: PH domain-containing protein [Clostridia bacterium]|nr:PH domain-containing protein [Clostridia bacterium]
MQDYDNSLLNTKPDSMQEFLEDGEEILWRGKPKMFSFIMSKILTMLPVAAIFLAFDSFMIAGISSGYQKSGQAVPIYLIVILVVFFSIHLYPVWRWLWSVITAGRKFKNAEYCITDRKVIIQGGFVKKEYQVIRFYEISSIYCRINFFEKLLGIGDLCMYVSKSSTLFKLDDIAEPRTIEKQLKELVKAYKKLHKDLVKKAKAETPEDTGEYEDYDEFDDESEINDEI